MDSWVVHKFGGTSVGSADCMRKCAEIIKKYTPLSRVAVVVSAMGGKPKVTDMLLDSVHAASNGLFDVSQNLLQSILKKHEVCVSDVLKTSSNGQQILDKISSDLKDINDLLRAVALMRMAHEQILELVSGYGEVWSASIMTEFMKCENLPFTYLNARDVLIVSEEEGMGTKIHWEISQEKLNKYIAEMDTKPQSRHLMITGYIAANPSGVATTLKRDGSDFSASIFGKLLHAKDITIWTDVSGVYSADPRRVPEAQIIPEVSYTEAIELAYFGAKVIHPKTMFPAIMEKIPIFIRNTFEPEHPGTRIFVSPAKGQLVRENCVCGFSTVDNIALLNIEGTGMIGVPGIAHRLFGALKNANISVMFIAQASSEHSICCAFKNTNIASARKTIQETFYYELKSGLISKITEIDNCSIIAAVGESMSNMPGVSGIFFGALGKAKINVLSTAQGCDERNISAVVHGSDAAKALRAVHSAFWLSYLEISIGVIGTGRVGSAVLQTLIDQLPFLNERFSLNLKIRGIANSTRMLLGDDLEHTLKSTLQNFFEGRSAKPLTPPSAAVSNGTCRVGMKRAHSNLSFNDVKNVMTTNGNGQVSTDISAFLKHVVSGDTPNAIIIDCSNSDEIGRLHPHWLLSGAHVVTSSKRGISSTNDLFLAINSAVKSSACMYMSETTIGASLPIRTTLQDILYSGDAVHSIVGLMSVSVGSVVTDMCENKLSFTEALQRTHTTGLFEDDVFKDLEGTEAAQKLLILARELGFSVDLEDIEIEPLAPRRDVSSWDALGDLFKEEDAKLRARAQAASEKNCTLRYVQRITCNPPVELGYPDSMRSKPILTVRLEEVPQMSSYAMVKGPVYFFAFHTARYSQNPLIVQGPLSDPANTASGVVGDILRIAKSLGAKDKGNYVTVSSKMNN